MKARTLLFTKIFIGCSAEEVGQAAKSLGFDGLDLAVRAGQCVEPATIVAALPAAMEQWHDQDLTVPMLTMEGDFTDPRQPDAEQVFAACQKSGIRLVKLGYWRWQPGQEYWGGVSEIRRRLEGFQKLGEQYEVCSLVHTHSGKGYGSNASSAMHLVKGFDPNQIGVYLDPAHQALAGEKVALSLVMVGKYLKMIGVKNIRYVETKSDQGARWKPEMCLLQEGLVDWRSALSLIQESGHDGPLSVHAEYSAFRDRQGALNQLAKDMAYLQSITQ